MYASGISGLIMTVLLKRVERERPPKSDNLAPLMAKIGCPLPSNVSACRVRKEKANKLSIEKVHIFYGVNIF